MVFKCIIHHHLLESRLFIIINDKLKTITLFRKQNRNTSLKQVKQSYDKAATITTKIITNRPSKQPNRFSRFRRQNRHIQALLGSRARECTTLRAPPSSRGDQTTTRRLHRRRRNRDQRLSTA